jgi:hypothetical protein
MPAIKANAWAARREGARGFRCATKNPAQAGPEGHGQVIAIIRGIGETCPVKAVKAWLQAAGIIEGPIFRPVAKGGRLGSRRLTGKSVCTLVQAYAGRLGLDGDAFCTHSLRSGLMRDVSRHKSIDVLQAYARDADLFRDHAGAGLL